MYYSHELLLNPAGNMQLVQTVNQTIHMNKLNGNSNEENYHKAYGMLNQIQPVGGQIRAKAKLNALYTYTLAKKMSFKKALVLYYSEIHNHQLTANNFTKMLLRS
jgi:hypothetical protein